MSNETNLIVNKKNLLSKASYGTGKILKKFSAVGKIVDSRPWKKVVTKTQGICETVGEKTEGVLKQVEKTVKKNAKEIKKSFSAGMKSASDEAMGAASHTATIPDTGINNDVKQKTLSDSVTATKKKAKRKTGGKTKSLARKSKDQAIVENEPPVNNDLENEIEAVTKDLKDI